MINNKSTVRRKSLIVLLIFAVMLTFSVPMSVFAEPAAENGEVYFIQLDDSQGAGPATRVFTIYGDNLTADNVEVKAEDTETSTVVSGISVKSEGSGGKITASVTFPAQTTDVTYQISARSTGQSDYIECGETVTIAGDPSAAGGQKGVIESVNASPAQISAAGGTVQLSLTGTDLDNAELQISSSSYYEGLEESADAVQQLQGLTIAKDGADVTIPENKQSNVIEHKFTVSVKGKEQDAKTVTVKQAAASSKFSSSELAVKNAVISGADGEMDTVAVTFENALPKQAADFVKHIYIANGAAGDQDVYRLTDSDSYEIQENTVILHLSKSYDQAGETTKIYFEEGAFSENNKVNRAFSWFLTSGAEVSSIQFDQDTLDYKGGQVTARLKGSNLDKAESIN